MIKCSLRDVSQTAVSPRSTRFPRSGRTCNDGSGRICCGASADQFEGTFGIVLQQRGE